MFCGTRLGEDLATHYASADIFLFPSRSETFGNVVTEAMASGLAVIAYNEAAAGEHISDGDNGVLVEPQAKPDFVTATRELCSKPGRAAVLGGNAARHVQTLDWQHVVQRFAALLDEHVMGDGL